MTRDGVLRGIAQHIAAAAAMLHLLAAGDEAAALQLQLLGRDPNQVNDEGDTPLHVACWSGSSRAVRVLVAAPRVQLTLCNAKGMTPLMEAFAAREMTCCYILINACTIKDLAVASVVAKQETSILHDIIAARHADALSALLRRIDDIADTSGDAEALLNCVCQGDTPLIKAVRCSWRTGVAALLACDRVDADQQSDAGDSLLAVAITAGDPHVLGDVLALCPGAACVHAGVSIDAMTLTPTRNREVIHAALSAAMQQQKVATRRSTIMSRSLAKLQQQQPQEQQQQKKKGKRKKRRKPRPVAIDDLAEECCDDDAYSQHAASPHAIALSAVHRNSTTSGCALPRVASSAQSAKYQDDPGTGPVKTYPPVATGDVQLLVAVQEQDDVFLRDFLKQTGSMGARTDINCCNDYKDTPMHLAVTAGATACVTALLDHGASVWVVNQDGATPLHLAVSGGHAAMLPLLIAAASASLSPAAYAAWLDSRDQHGATALHYAACVSAPMLEYLMQAGASVEAVDTQNHTPLHDAAVAGRLDCAAALLRAGADVNAVNQLGETALHLAVYTGRHDLAKALVQAHHADVSIAKSNGKLALDLAMDRDDLVLAHWLEQQHQRAVHSRLSVPSISAAVSSRRRRIFDPRRYLTMISSQTQSPLHGAMAGRAAGTISLRELARRAAWPASQRHSYPEDAADVFIAHQRAVEAKDLVAAARYLSRAALVRLHTSLEAAWVRDNELCETMPSQTLEHVNSLVHGLAMLETGMLSSRSLNSVYKAALGMQTHRSNGSISSGGSSSRSMLSSRSTSAESLRVLRFAANTVDNAGVDENTAAAALMTSVSNASFSTSWREEDDIDAAEDPDVMLAGTRFDSVSEEEATARAWQQVLQRWMMESGEFSVDDPQSTVVAGAASEPGHTSKGMAHYTSMITLPATTIRRTWLGDPTLRLSGESADGAEELDAAVTTCVVAWNARANRRGVVCMTREDGRWRVQHVRWLQHAPHRSASTALMLPNLARSASRVI